MPSSKFATLPANIIHMISDFMITETFVGEAGVELSLVNRHFNRSMASVSTYKHDIKYKGPPRLMYGKKRWRKMNEPVNRWMRRMIRMKKPVNFCIRFGRIQDYERFIETYAVRFEHLDLKHFRIIYASTETKNYAEVFSHPIPHSIPYLRLPQHLNAKSMTIFGQFLILEAKAFNTRLFDNLESLVMDGVTYQQALTDVAFPKLQVLSTNPRCAPNGYQIRSASPGLSDTSFCDCENTELCPTCKGCLECDTCISCERCVACRDCGCELDHVNLDQNYAEDLSKLIKSAPNLVYLKIGPDTLGPGYYSGWRGNLELPQRMAALQTLNLTEILPQSLGDFPSLRTLVLNTDFEFLRRKKDRIEYSKLGESFERSVYAKSVRELVLKDRDLATLFVNELNSNRLNRTFENLVFLHLKIKGSDKIRPRSMDQFKRSHPKAVVQVETPENWRQFPRSANCVTRRHFSPLPRGLADSSPAASESEPESDDSDCVIN